VLGKRRLAAGRSASCPHCGHSFGALGIYEGDEGLGRAVIAQQYLRQRKAPCLSIYASKSAASLEEGLPHGDLDEIHVLDGGHFLHQQMPGEVNSLVLRWLGALP
jgi:pimeloyl-ACP methyl ester carboxylesterase